MKVTRNVIGEMTVSGYNPASVTFNPNMIESFIIKIVDDNSAYISKKGTDDWDFVDKSSFSKKGWIFDKLTNVYRFKINDGKYANEYVIEEFLKIDNFRSKKDYLDWMK